MPLLVGIALFGAAGANALIAKLAHILADPAERVPVAIETAVRFRKADWITIAVLTILLGWSVSVVVGRAIGHIDGSVTPRAGSVTAPVVDRLR